jgi:hypothetical protein
VALATVTEFEALDKQLVPLIALAVMTCPAESDSPLIDQEVPDATVDPRLTPSAYSSIVAADTDVPLIVVLLVVIDVVVITGAVVCAMALIQT